MCNPLIAAGLAIVSGISDYQTQSAIAKHSNKVADAQIDASERARNNTARQLNAKQDAEQMQIADKREEDQLTALEAIENQKARNAETGAEGRSIDLTVIKRENDLLKYNTSVNRVLDDLATAYSFKREGLETQLAGRIMQANASRKPKPSLGAAIVKTAASAAMAYGSANGGFGGDTASLSENFASFGSDMSGAWNSMSDSFFTSFSSLDSMSLPTLDASLNMGSYTGSLA
jgi:hypothetical protein